MYELPETYNNNGQEYNLVEALAHYSTDGLIVLKDGVMLYENYWNGNDISSQHISWSVAKSFLSALVGIAIEDGLIESVDDPITKYLKTLKALAMMGYRQKSTNVFYKV